jgi:chromosome segregation ATPase
LVSLNASPARGIFNKSFWSIEEFLMQGKFIRHTAFLLAVLVTIGLCVLDAGAQTRKKRRTHRATKRVVTNPPITPPKSQTPATSEEKIIPADEPAEEGEQNGAEVKPKKTKSESKSDDEDMQQTINALSNQVDRLTDKLTQMQENDKSLIDMERLTRAEQRAESLRSQQVDVESKLADLQSKLDQIEYALKPENIERVTQGYGTTRPEEARDSRRRQLENERSRTLAQIKILETSRARLETACANADAEVDLLRRKIQQQQDSAASAPPPEQRPANSKRKPQ